MKQRYRICVFRVVVVFVLLLNLVSTVVTQTRHAEAVSPSTVDARSDLTEHGSTADEISHVPDSLRTAERDVVPATPPVYPLVNAAPLAPAGGVVGNGTPASCTEAALNATLAGGGAITFNCGTSPVTLTLTSQKIIAVPTSIDGGGLIALSGGDAVRLFSVNAGASLSLANLTITQGRASGSSGGGIYNQGALTVTNARFVGNVADSFGGAILNYGMLELSDSALIGNHAGINGGGIDTTVLVTVTNSAFISNTAGFRGGAINNYLGSLSIVQDSFAGNSSNVYGGGVTNDAGVGSILGSSFINNTTQGFGGGLRNSGKLFVGDTTFSGNYAADKGGGLENSATLVVENSTFSGNSATNSGGGIENSTVAAITVTNGTVVTNTSALSSGGGNLTNNGLFQLKNTIVAYGSLFDCAGTLVSLGYNLYGGAACAPLAPGDIQTTDPLLGPLQDNGGPTLTHAPLPGSPLIDRIPLDACPPTDQRGRARPQGSLCDIGAVEQVVLLPKVYLPLIVK